MTIGPPSRFTAMKIWLTRRFRWIRSKQERDGLESRSTHHGIPLDLDALEHLLNRRIRMTVLRHTVMWTCIGILLIVAVIGGTIHFLVAPTAMKIAVGPPGSEDARFVEKLAENFEREHASIRLEPIIKPGPVEAKDTFGQPDFDLAVVSSLGMSPEWPVVAILRKNVMVLMVPAHEDDATKKKTTAAKKGKAVAAQPPKIEKIADLAGRRIGIVNGSEGGAEVLSTVLTHYGVALEKVQIVRVELANLRSDIRDRKFDAILVTGPAIGKLVSETVAAAASKDAGPSFVEIGQTEGIARRSPSYESEEIDAGTFGGVPPRPSEKLTTLSFPEYLVARKSFSDDKIAAFAKLLYTSRRTLAYQLPGTIKIESPSTDKDADAIVHPGAAVYLGDSQKTFFERYGDAIFYGMLIIPALGSGIAAFTGYFQADSRTRRVRLLHRLLQTIKKARTLNSLDELDRVEAEVDSVLGETIYQTEHDQLDETALMSFSLAIQQARLAVAERRALLLSQRHTGTPVEAT